MHTCMWAFTKFLTLGHIFLVYIFPFSKHILKDVSYAKFQMAMLLNYPDPGSDELNIVSIFPLLTKTFTLTEIILYLKSQNRI